MTDVGPESVLHQDDHEALIEDMIDGGATGENAAIADLVAITGGESPTEAEHNAIVTKVNSILAALRASKIIPT